MAARTFKSILPNGKIISIQSGENNILDFKKFVLDSDSGSTIPTAEFELSKYLKQYSNTLFTDIDYEFGLKKEVATKLRNDAGKLDFAYKRKDQNSCVAIEVRSPSYPRYPASNSFLDEYLVQSQSFENALVQFGKELLPISSSILITGRRRDRHIYDNIQRGEADYAYRILTWDEVLDTVIFDKENNTPEIVIQNVVDFSRKLLAKLIRKHDLLQFIDDRRFEELIATLLFDLGFQNIELTPPRKDGGKDIIAQFFSSTTGQKVTYYFECKHWVSGQKVSLNWAIKLLDVIQNDQVDAGILLTSSTFSPTLLQTEASFNCQDIYLKDEQSIFKLIEIWEQEYGALLITKPSFEEIIKTQIDD